jgi:hypothetical protein
VPAATHHGSNEGLRSLLLKHGLDLGGTIGGSLIWEPPIKIFRSSHVDDTKIRHVSIGRYCCIGDTVNMRGSAHP